MTTQYTLLTVEPTVNSQMVRDAADFINKRAGESGFAGGYSEREIQQAHRELEREIFECDSDIRDYLKITQQTIELDD